MTSAPADRRELLSLLAQAGRQLDAATLIEYRRYGPNARERMRQPLADCTAVTLDGYRMAATQLSRCRQAAVKAQEAIRRIADTPAGQAPAAADHIKRIQANAVEMLSQIDAATVANREKRDRLSAFNITLFGRTMSGKSTLMEILTGGDGSTIGKGAQRTTRDQREYTWLNDSLTITDVPGIEAVGGAEDEQNAHHAARSADLILFLITDDAPQPGEALHLNALQNQGRPLFGVMNVKRAVGNPIEKRRFIRDRSKIFDPVRLYQIKRQFNELIDPEQMGKPLELIPVHMLARFQADRESTPATRDSLESASRFWELESKILNTIIQQGPYLRQRSFLDTAADANRRTELGLNVLASHLTQQSERIAGRLTELRSYQRSFERQAQQQTEQAIHDTIGNLRRGIYDFAYQNWNNRDVQRAWDQRIRSANLNQRLKHVTDSYAQQVQTRLSQLVEGLLEELRLLDINFQTADIGPANATDTRKIFGILSIASGLGTAGLTGALFLAGVTLGWNPVGWALIGLGAVTTAIGMARNLFKSQDQKRNEATAQLTPQLNRHLDGIEQQVRQQLSRAREQLLRNISDTATQIGNLETAARNTAQALATAAGQHHAIRQDLDRRIVTLALKQAGSSAIGYRLVNVEREPGQLTTIITKPGTRQLTGQTLKQLEQLMGEPLIQRNQNRA